MFGWLSVIPAGRGAVAEEPELDIMPLSLISAGIVVEFERAAEIIVD